MGGSTERRADVLMARSERPRTVTWVKVKEKIDQRMRDNCRITVNETASEIRIIKRKRL
jgi:hypothetical protein